MTNDHLYQVIEMEEINQTQVSKEAPHGYLRSVVHDPLDAAAET